MRSTSQAMLTPSLRVQGRTGGKMTYRVFGTAHGTEFDERGFETSAEAEAYASSVIDGDLDSDVEVLPE